MSRGESLLPDQPYQNALHLLHAHIHILDDSPVEHSCRHIPPTAFLLQGMEPLEGDTFPIGEPIFHIREIVTWVTGRHERGFLPYKGSELPRHDSHEK